MIEPGALLAWSALALAVTVSPGPDTMLVASHSARSGLRAGLAAVAGIGTGGVFYAALFGFGLLRLLAATPALFMAVKIAGAIYLAWLGAQFLWRAIRPVSSPARGGSGVREANDEGGGATPLCQPAARPDSSPVNGGANHGAPFRQALLTNILNPKVAVFYLAALPQFAGAGADAPLIGAMLIGIHFALGVTWLSGIAVAASHARRITLNSAFARWLEGAIGAFFLGVAGRLALTER